MTTSDLGGNVTPTTTGPAFTEVNCSGDVVDVTPSPCGSDQEWYNATSCSCQTLPLRQIMLSDPAGIVFLTIAIFSVVLDLGVITVFILNRHTPIVKASNRELSFLLLFVLMVSFVFPLVHIGPMEAWKCVVTVFQGPVNTCVSAIFLIKTHRVLSIFEARLPKVVHRQWILGRNLQFIGVFILTLVQIIVSVVCMGIFPPAVEYTLDPELMVIYVDCESVELNNIINSAYPVFLLILSLIFAFRARHLPENYGESRHILASMAAGLIIFLTCLGLSFIFQGTTKTIILNVYVSINPLIQLMLLFLPKVYIILVCPERNTVQELRRMTLAHMQRQSEFSPTEGAVKDSDCRRQNHAAENVRLKSLRSLRNKLRGLSTGSTSALDAPQNGSAGRPMGNRKISVQVPENGTLPLQNGAGHGAPVNHRYSRSGGTTDATVEAKASRADNRRVGAKPPYRLRNDNMRRQSSGLFVIQFLDEKKESQCRGDSSTAPEDGQVKFNLRETDGDGEGEGDMFVVSMLGRTLTLKEAEDRKPRVPQILGGVYVGSKTVPSTGGTKASNEHTDTQGSCSSLTNKQDFSGGPECQSTESLSTADGHVTNKPNFTKGGNLSKSQSQESSNDNSDGETVARVKNHNRHDNETKRATTREDRTGNISVGPEDTSQDVNEVDRDSAKEFPLYSTDEKDSGDNNTSLNNKLSPNCIDLSKSSSVTGNPGSTECQTDTTPGKYRTLSPARSTRNTDNTDAASESSLSSTSTIFETAADDKLRLLRRNSCNQMTASAKSISPDEPSALDMDEIALQLNGTR